MFKGRDLKQPKIKVQLGEQEFELKYDMNALELIEDFYGSVDEGFAELFNGSIKSTKILLWIGINSGRDELIPLDEVGSLVAIQDVPELTRFLIGSFFDNLPEDKESGKK